jgi:hypothetical protein
MQPPTATDLIGQLLLAAPGYRRVLAGAENAKQSVDLGDPVPGPGGQSVRSAELPDPGRRPDLRPPERDRPGRGRRRIRVGC